MFKRILLPTDGSELSSRAVLAGVSFAKEVGAQVIGMTALPDFKTFTADADMLESTEDEYLAASEVRGARHLATISDAARAARHRAAWILVAARRHGAGGGGRKRGGAGPAHPGITTRHRGGGADPGAA